jgi:hypothetical protein
VDVCKSSTCDGAAFWFVKLCERAQRTCNFVQGLERSDETDSKDDNKS